MNARFDLYLGHDSWVHRLDPRTKLAFVGASFVLLLPSSQPLFLASYLVCAHLLLWTAHVPWHRIRSLWHQMLPLTLLVVLLWPLFYPAGEPVLWSFWRLRITLPSVLLGLAAALRIGSLAFAVFVLLVTTDQSRLVQGMVRLGIPFEWGLTLAIALRYLPLLYSVHGTIRDAQRSRGWTADQGPLLSRLKAYIPLLVALVIASLRLSDTLTLALAARGFRPGQPRTTYRALRMKSVDWWMLVVLGSTLLAAGGHIAVQSR
jgi:energy-coupling factor transport system permease protein